MAKPSIGTRWVAKSGVGNIAIGSSYWGGHDLNNVYKSVDNGFSWVLTAAFGADYIHHDMTTNGSTFLLTSTAFLAPSRTWYSTDLINWGYEWWFGWVHYAATYYSPYFVIASSHYDAGVYDWYATYSTDCITWSYKALILNIPQRARGIKHNGSKFIIVGDGGLIFSSSDPSGTWVAGTNSDTNPLYSVYGDTTINIAVGENGTILTATDPTGTWTKRTSGTTNHLYSVNFVNGLYVCGGQLWNTILISKNGIDWIKINAPNANFYGNNAIAGTKGEICAGNIYSWD